jgi:preprotein translocase subunit SecF
MRRLFSDAHFDFLGFRRRAYVASAIVLSIGLAVALYWQVTAGSWLRYGVDFTGGTLIQVEFNRAVEVAELRSVIDPLFPGAEITRFGQGDGFLIRTQTTQEATSGAAQVIPDALRQHFGGDAFTIEQTDDVGAKVGGELQTRALLAILLSFAATLIYLAFRFEWRFGLAAVIATAHDILVTIGILVMLRLEVTLPTVAAVLTIVGYSLNDTIVIFDRIRENLSKVGRRESFIAVLNRSINETLPRTVLTTATTLATLIALFMFGGTVIRDFALILIVGITLGTYSSIFVAAPALFEIEKRWPAERKKAKIAKVRAAT